MLRRALFAALVAGCLLTAAPAYALPAGFDGSSSSAPVDTGLPVISGTLKDGSTLTTTNGSWSSSSPLTYSYQWERCTAGTCTGITHATSKTYVLTSTDVSHEITVVVKATDQNGQSGHATATPVGPVKAPAPPSNTAAPAISGSTQDGDLLTTTTGTWKSPDALSYRYQWERCSSAGASCAAITGATARTYKLSYHDVGSQVGVVVTAIDKESQTGSSTAAPVGPVTAPPPPSNTGLPVISGTTRAGADLTTTPGSWSSPDTLGYRYQWRRCGGSGGNCADISGATKSSYMLTSSDVNHQVTVEVTALDKESQSGQATATPVGPVGPAQPPSNLTPPTISGSPRTPNTLSIDNGTWSSSGQLTYSYQWRRCDNTGANCTNITGQTSQYYTLTSNDVNHDIAAAVTGTDPLNQTASASAAPVGPVSVGPTLTGIHKIQHVVIIMQENRSFDNYFGTYPGADGIPAGVCVPDPLNGGCAKPYHSTADKDIGGPHGSPAAAGDIDKGKMDGFIGRAETDCGSGITICAPCQDSTTFGCIDVMGYYDSHELPNYWTYAQDFVLQDHLFESSASASGPSHLYTVSGWSAACSNPLNPSSCTSNVSSAGAATSPHFPWTDITYLLHGAGVSWAYYVFAGSEPDCEIDAAVTCGPVHQTSTTPGIWNPLPAFETVGQDNQIGNVQTLNNFFTAAKAGALPAVSWIAPNGYVSEHPPGKLSTGQTYVTGLINAIMQSPDWGSTAIFLSWDDWGGFYDNVVPPAVDQSGYGLRVPGLVISPYAKHGYIDSQTLSHDAYLKFIEDDFLGGKRIDPATDGRPDPRPDVRENAAQLGNLTSDFDFTQTPRAPVILPVCPQTDLTPTPSC